MPKKIIYNLVEFTRAMVDFISDGSEAGQIRLVDVFKQAQTKYSTVESSYIVRLITYFSRYRDGDFDKTISDLQAFPDPMIRLQEFKKFVSEGEWKSTSANTLVLTYLIRAISGYENDEQSLSDQYIHQVLIPHLKELINNDIDNLLVQQRIAAEQAETRKKELLAMVAGQRKTAEGILLIANDLEAGKALARHPEKDAEQLASTVGQPYELCLRPKNFLLDKAEKNKLYLILVKVSLVSEPRADSSEPATVLAEDVLQFSVMNLSGKLITQTINKKELKHEIAHPLTEEKLLDLQETILAIVAKRGHILSIADLVRGSIKSADNNPVKREFYKGIDAFAPSPEEVTTFKPGSFIATRKEKQWQLYYIDTLQKAVKVDHSTQKGLTELFAGWEDESAALSQSQLDGLAKVLGDFKPAELINMNKFSALDQLIGQSQKKPKIEEESRVSNPGKLNLKNFAIARGFGHKPREDASMVCEEQSGVAQPEGVNFSL